MTASPVKKRYIQHVAIIHRSSNKSPLKLELSVRETRAGKQCMVTHKLHLIHRRVPWNMAHGRTIMETYYSLQSESELLKVRKEHEKKKKKKNPFL